MPHHKSAVEFAVDEIKRRIIEQELAPGSKVDQTVLAEMLGLSRIPIRQALAELAQRGFIQQQAHKPAIVAQQSRSDVNHLYHLRGYLEALSLKKVISRFGEKEFLVLEEKTKAMVLAARNQDLARYMNINRQFHFFLFSATDNPHLLRILESLFDLTERYQWMCLNKTQNLKRSIDGHRSLIASLRQGDADGVRQVLSEHNRKTQEWILNHVV